MEQTGINIGAGFLKSFIQRYPVSVLEMLLKDQTTKNNIIWADDEYEALGNGYMGNDEITLNKITGLASGVIKPRIAKEQEKQSQRTKSRAEVFTPSWLCNQMNNDLDAIWFGKRALFNSEVQTEAGLKTWEATLDHIEFPQEENCSWDAYIKARKLEITCGEAPFICSRYDTVNGVLIPVKKRIGFLDRKLRVVSENTDTPQEWLEYAFDALKATYGFEYQGDNLLIARINVFETFMEHMQDQWPDVASSSDIDWQNLCEQVAHIVSWNLWQMDGFSDAVPTNKMDVVVQSSLSGKPQKEPEPQQMSLFDFFDDSPEEKIEEEKEIVPLCVLRNWEEDKPFEFASLKGGAYTMSKFFYAVIGNPPYQEEKDDNARKPPIYHHFMDSSYAISSKVELITPARFLFNAGQTPKDWNRKMLSDPHLKVLSYEDDASIVFQGTDIKGGVAVTLHDELENFGAIEVFIPYKELKSILAKVQSYGFSSVSDEVTGAVPYRFTVLAQEEHPEYVSDMGKSLDLRTNVLDKLQNKLFFKSPPNHKEYVSIYGLLNKKRDSLWIKRSYIDVPINFEGYKVLLPKASGSGAFGERLAEISIAYKKVGHTQSFVSIGNFENKEEAESFCKYIKCKFVRSLLGIYKVTQDITPRVWQFVPLQDFTSASDIDWTKSIPEIDQQLYAKYGLDENEINFI